MDTQKRTNYKRAFNEKAYDRISVTIPKGCKSAVETHAKSKGESVNGLVNALLRQDMGLQDWSEVEQLPEE